MGSPSINLPPYTPVQSTATVHAFSPCREGGLTRASNALVWRVSVGGGQHQLNSEQSEVILLIHYKKVSHI